MESVGAACEVILAAGSIGSAQILQLSGIGLGALLRDNNILDRYADMIKAMSEVVQRGGYGTSVTPVSQFYFQQAYMNVTQGRWKKITSQYGNMVLGYFGRTPVEPDPKIVKPILIRTFKITDS